MVPRGTTRGSESYDLTTMFIKIENLDLESFWLLKFGGSFCNFLIQKTTFLTMLSLDGSVTLRLNQRAI